MLYGRDGGYGSVPRKKNLGLIIGILMVLVVLVVVGGIFLYKTLNSKNSIQMYLDMAFDYLESSVDNNDYDSVTGNFSIEMNLQEIDNIENYQLYEMFNKIKISGNYEVDYSSNIMNIGLGADYDNKKLMDIDIYTAYGKAYIYLVDLYDRYIEESLDNYSDLFERNTDDQKNVIVGLKRAFDGSLKEEYYTEEKVTVDSRKLTKTVLNLTGENYLEFYKDFSDILLDDKEFLESFAEIFGTDVDKVKAELSYDEDKFEGTDGLKLVLYTDKFAFVKLEMLVSDDMGRIVVEKVNEAYEYVMYDDGVEILSGVVKVVNDDNSSNVSFSFYVPEEKMGIEFILESSFELNGKVQVKDVTNSVSLDKITDDELMDIYNKLIENEGVVEIIQEVSDLIGQTDYNDSLSIVTS